MHGKNVSSCLVVDDIGNLDVDFHPKDLDCSHYSRVYRNVSIGGDMEGFQLGTRISFDIPDHIPNPCDECEKSHGNCGVGLRCICHPKDCRDKVISIGARIFPLGSILYPLLSFVVMRELYRGS
ncbi:hypothetical protein RJ639_047511 [Escallonia herrerae]|uniref:Wall-associated receptor kinase C-terminal domain-containing protein n=1 Tax=Escallonia herrerae TaxID=1293975 RepID=A0AA89B1K9_9ASTE|nr:hypothetical protein RJ639_047511 [Escallonia herrerae]